MSKLPLHPTRPETICWGCDKYCPANDLRCANGTVRAPHPCELFGDDWLDWSIDARGAGTSGTVVGECFPQRFE